MPKIPKNPEPSPYGEYFAILQKWPSSPGKMRPNSSIRIKGNRMLNNDYNALQHKHRLFVIESAQMLKNIFLD